MTSAGSEAVELAASAGLFLDDWQRFVLDESLGERVDGQWSAFEVGLIVPRQNGKGAILEARELAGLFLFDERLILHSAHEFKTAWEAFLRIKTLIENTPDLSKKVGSIRQSHADVCIELKNGARLRFVARSRGSGRGFTGDLVILDEAYNLDAAAMAALLPTLSARPNPQIWYTSSAPMADSSQLHALRRRVKEGDAGQLAFFEWSIDSRSDITDPRSWAEANPALGIRIREEFVAAELRAMSDSLPEFARERLGIADDEDGTAGVIQIDRWDELVDIKSEIVAGLALAVDVSPERSWASIAAAGQRADGLRHVEVTFREPGTGWLLERVVEQARKWRVPIRLDPGSPAGSLITPLTEAGVEVVEVGGRELTQACGAFADAVINGTVRHLGQSSLHNALTGASKRTVGDAWAWSRRSSAVDISPLVAATLAHGAPAPEDTTSVYEGRSLVVIG